MAVTNEGSKNKGVVRIASATLANLYKRQGHADLAERTMADLEGRPPVLSAGPTPDQRRKRQIRKARQLLQRVRSRARRETP